MNFKIGSGRPATGATSRVATINNRSTSRRLIRSLSAGLLSAILTPGVVLAQAVPPGCGELRIAGRFGPFDYRANHYAERETPQLHAERLRLVEHGHFTPEVEGLLRGKTTTFPGGDLTYTLHAFPNHHRALLAMIALGKKEKTENPKQSEHSVECWLQRAVAWQPDDYLARLIYAGYLTSSKRLREAEQQVNIAAEQAKDNPFTHLNVGLAYFDMGKYDLALEHAHRAIELGLKTPILVDQLKSAGKWSE